MKRFATLAMLALLSGAAWSQPTATPATGTPVGSDKAPGTAASDVSPTRPVQGPSGGSSTDPGTQGSARQHDATKGTGTSSKQRGEAGKSDRSNGRSASAAESYGYPASPAKAR